MDAFDSLIKSLPAVKAERDFSFAKHTCIGSGGVAALALSPENIEEAAQCLTFLDDEGIPYCFLGAGANVLPRDGRFEGVVLRFHRMKKLFSGNGFVFAGAGVTGGELLSFAKKNSVTGFEPFTGIPTTVGGGVAMNAGIAARHFSDLVLSVVGFRDGQIETFTNRECLFSLKESVFLSGIAVLGVYFRAESATQEEIRKQTAYYADRRKHLPKGRSMGCTFVNPEGISAGELIDGCGLKGRSVGKAFVSERHANFIINGGASSEEIARLVEEVKNEVYIKTGIRLREEIRRIP